MNESVNSKKRLQVDFTEDALKELDEVQRLSGLATRAELIRQSLGFYRWLLDEVAVKGSTFLVEKNGQLREIVIPTWSTRSSHTNQDQSEPRGSQVLT